MKKIYSNPDKAIQKSLKTATAIEDFLPPPSELVRKSKKERVTILLDASCVEFFKAAAKKSNSKYQTMMNEVLVQYAKHYSKA